VLPCVVHEKSRNAIEECQCPVENVHCFPSFL
jgi:hypothetical protein